MQLTWGNPRDLASREERRQLIELDARELDQIMHQALVIEAMNHALAQAADLQLDYEQVASV